MNRKDRFPWAVCNTAREYIEIAIALETLAYHNKNYLDSVMCKDKERNEEVRLLLLESLKKYDEEKRETKK